MRAAGNGQLIAPAIDPSEAQRYACEVIEAEARSLLALKERIDESFVGALDLLMRCHGRIVVSGMGKAGFVGQKISATLSSTGSPSLFLHPADALHGDLGRVTGDDLVLALSNSGETEEILRLVIPLRKIGTPLVAITGDTESRLARVADVVLDLGPIDEVCPIGLAPTASTTAMLVMGDALSMALMRTKRFGRDEYALLHPAGALGRQLMQVGDVMRTAEANPLVSLDTPLSQVVAVMTNTPGRPGAATVVDATGRLAGIFTDGDLRRLIEHGHTDFSAAVGCVMSRDPRTVTAELRVLDAMRVLRQAKIDQVPVIDELGQPIGLLDVQDLLEYRVV